MKRSYFLTAQLPGVFMTLAVGLLPCSAVGATPNPPLLPYLFDHRWPNENPSLFPTDCGGTQPIVSGVLGEYRPTAQPHYHGGADIAIPAGTSVYSVLQDLVFVEYIDNNEVGIRVSWVGDQETYYRYLHVTDIRVQEGDEIVWNPAATGRYFDAPSATWKYPVHLKICQVANTSPPHLHYEEIWADLFSAWHRFNPLFWLCPWTDTRSPAITGVSAFRGDGDAITRGSGTEFDPWIVSNDFDLRVHVHDTLPNRLSNKAGIWQIDFGMCQ